MHLLHWCRITLHLLIISYKKDMQKGHVGQRYNYWRVLNVLAAVFLNFSRSQALFVFVKLTNSWSSTQIMS